MDRLKNLTLFLFYIFTFINCLNEIKVTPEVQQELDKGNMPNVMVEFPKSQSIET